MTGRFCCASCASVARQLRDKLLMLLMLRDFLARTYTRHTSALLEKCKPCATAKHKQPQQLIAQQVAQLPQQIKEVW